MKKLVAGVAAAGLLSAGLIVMAAETANAASCSTYANTPYRPNSGQTASGKGGRTNCTSSVSSVTVKLVHVQTWELFNEVKASNTANKVVNLNRTVSWTRPDSGTANGWTWRTETTSSSGQQTYSATTVLWK